MGRKRDGVPEDETDYTYNNVNQMTAAGNISYSWDDAGNMATKVVNQQTTTYTWDVRNKLVAVGFPEGGDVSLRYDGSGARHQEVAGDATTKLLCAAGSLAFQWYNQWAGNCCTFLSLLMCDACTDACSQAAQDCRQHQKSHGCAPVP